MIVRDLRRQDIPAIVQGLTENFPRENALQGWDPTHVEGVLRRVVGFPVGWIWAFLRGIHRSPVRFLVAVEDADVAGTTLVFLSPGYAYLAMVMTLNRFRRRGVGRALLTEAERTARRRHRSHCLLDVLRDNLPARQLYESRGYRPLRQLSWLVRDLPPEGAPKGPFPEIRPFTSADVPGVLSLKRGIEPPEVREVLEPRPENVAPSSTVQSLLGSRSAGWCTGPLGRPRAYVGATISSFFQAGQLGLPLFSCQASEEERRQLIGTALEWLRALGIGRVIAEVPHYARGSREALEGAGFGPGLELDTLVLPLRNRDHAPP